MKKRKNWKNPITTRFFAGHTDNKPVKPSIYAVFTAFTLFSANKSKKNRKKSVQV
tara:strand:+ start:2737 stop:2901 length:165 start_codon:yes stop_codon:yes gene_type:complete